MSRHQLPEEKLQAGRQALALLDEYELGVQGAAWIYIDVLKEWRFYIVTSLVTIDGLVDTHDRITRLFRLRFANPSLDLEDIHLASPDEQLFLALSQVFHVQNGLVELENVGVNQLKIEHAYIYRLDRAPLVIKAKEARHKFDKKLKELERAAG